MMGLGQEAVAGMSGVYKRILLHEEGNRMLHPDHPERNAHKLAAAFKMTIQQILMVRMSGPEELSRESFWRATFGAINGARQCGF